MKRGVGLLLLACATLGAALIFLAIDGHLLTVSVLYQSFLFWPVGSGLYQLNITVLLPALKVPPLFIQLLATSMLRAILNTDPLDSVSPPFINIESLPAARLTFAPVSIVTTLKTTDELYIIEVEPLNMAVPLPFQLMRAPAT